MANVFTDPDCVALYDPTSWLDLGRDKKGSNHFAIFPFPQTSDRKEGNGALDCERDYGSTWRLGSPSSDFPGMTGQGSVSVTFWIKIESFPETPAGQVIEKLKAYGYIVWSVQVYHTTGHNQVRLGIGYNSSTGYEWFTHASDLQAGRWYFVGVSYNAADKGYLLRIWDDTAGAILGTDKTGTATNSMYCDSGVVLLSNYNSGTDGLLDDMAIFNDALTAEEIDACRDGTYEYGADANCVAHWPFDSDDPAADDIGKNAWTASTGLMLDTTNYQTGTAAMRDTVSTSYGARLADADAGADFPLKVGDATKKISVCVWVRPVAINSAWPIFAKYATLKNTILISMAAPSKKPALYVGYNSGSSWEPLQADNPVFVEGRWYHLGVTYDDSDKSYRIRCYDQTAAAVYEKTGNATNNINIEDSSYQIGQNVAGYTYGAIDELVIFKDILTADEIDAIRSGTFGASAGKGPLVGGFLTHNHLIEGRLAVC